MGMGVAEVPDMAPARPPTHEHQRARAAGRRGPPQFRRPPHFREAPLLRDPPQMMHIRHGSRRSRRAPKVARTGRAGICSSRCHEVGRSLLEEDPDATADALDRVAPGDGDAWLDLVAQWDAVRDDVLAALFTPFPPLRAVARLLWRSGARGTR